MTIHEARVIAFLRIHFGCSISKLGGIAEAIWGNEHANQIAGTETEIGGILGQALLCKMEDTLEIERGESDEMELSEQICLNCKRTQYAMSYKADTGKECQHCGGMNCYSFAGTKEEE